MDDLADSGFDIVSTANNHCCDVCGEGLKQARFFRSLTYLITFQPRYLHIYPTLIILNRKKGSSRGPSSLGQEPGQDDVTQHYVLTGNSN